MIEILPALHRQVEYGDVMIINKADLIGEKDIVEISEQIQEINPSAHLYVTSYCRVDIRDIVESMESTERVGEESTNTFESRPNTLVLSAEAEIDTGELRQFLDEISQHTYRIKGFSQTEQGPIEISGVGRNIHLNPWHTEINGSQIVVISAVGIKILSVITAALEKKLKGKLHL